MSQGFDRSKFKATRVAVSKQADTEVESLVRRKDFVTADFIDLKKLGSGTYKFRIYPPHPADGGDQYAEAKAVHWLVVDKPEFKDGQPVYEKDGKTPVLKRGPKPFFNSRIHGGTKKDIIEEYITFAEKLAKENFPGDDKKQKEFLDPIYGGYNSNYDGIMVRLSWVMYVDLISPNGDKTFGRFEIGKAIKQRLNAIAASEGANDPLGTDPFTDPSEGRAVNITYNSAAKRSQDYYVTELDTSFDSKTKMVNFYPLSDADLEKFVKYPSLHSMFKNAYKRKDFDEVIKGLQIFDNEYNVGVFQYDEFLDICEEISSYYPDSSEEEKLKEDQKTGKDINKMFSEQKPKNKVSALAKQSDVFDDMDRQELKDFCKEEKTGIIVIPKMSDDDIRESLRQWYNNTNGDGDIEEVEEEKPTPKTNVFERKLVSKKEVITEEDNNEAGDGLPWDKDGNDIRPKVEEEKPKSTTTLSAKDKVRQLRQNLSKK